MKPDTHSVTLAHLQALDFWSLVAMRGPDECWTLNNRRPETGPNRRGIIYLPKSLTGLRGHVYYSAARAAKALQLGRLVPRHLVVDHLCFNPPCVNPAHLDVVTQRTNLRRRRMVNHA